jgi:hypothetical protein
MPVNKPEPQGGKPPAPQTPDRKPWKKKTPVEVVLEQEKKLKQEITDAEQDLKEKRAQLQKFEQARKIFEGT